MDAMMMWVLGFGVLAVATFEPRLFFWGVLVVIAWQALEKVVRGESFRPRGLPRVPTPPGYRREHH